MNTERFKNAGFSRGVSRRARKVASQSILIFCLLTSAAFGATECSLCKNEALGINVKISSDPIHFQHNMIAASDPTTGNYLFTWITLEHQSLGPNVWKIKARLFNYLLKPISGTLLLEATPQPNEANDRPVLAFNSRDHQFIVLWTIHYRKNLEYVAAEIHAQRLSANCTPIGPRVWLVELAVPDSSTLILRNSTNMITNSYWL